MESVILLFEKNIGLKQKNRCLTTPAEYGF